MVNLALDFILIPRYGVMGAAVANVSIQVISVATGLTYSWLRLGLKYPVLDGARVLSLAAISAAFAWWLTRLASGWGSLGLGVAGAGLVYVTLLFATRTLTKKEVTALIRGQLAP